MRERTFRAAFLFAGLGAGARGFLEARGRLGEDRARFVNVGGIDIDAESCADFERLALGPALRADVSTLTPAELRSAWGDEAPDCVFLSPPCKGFSGLLSAASAERPEYQRLNALVHQGIFLLLEAWPHRPPPTIVLENVPRITSRGAILLHQVRDRLTRAGYRLHEGHHECGEVGGLGQRRRRFLLVARHERQVGAFIYRPPVQRVKGCGEVLGALPLPYGEEGALAGPMHALPRLSWLTWVRLSLIPPGGDWRDLPGVVQAGHQRRSVWARYDVRGWQEPARTVAGEGSNGGFGVADPRLALADRPGRHRNQYRVTDWGGPAGTVIGATRPGSGAGVVADPRLEERGAWRGSLGVTAWEDAAACVRASSNVRTSPSAIADPRIIEAVALKQSAEGAGSFKGRPRLFGVADWQKPTSAITGSASPTGSNGVAVIADPRVIEDAAQMGCAPRAGTFGVLDWRDAASTVTGNARVDNGRFAVADPRHTPAAPPVIRSPWDCWHRPMSTLELATLQGLPAELDGEPLVLAGTSVGRWRERIGNAVPVGAARAIGDSILTALLAAALGSWALGSTGIWVRDDGRSEHEWSAEIAA